MGHAVVDHRFRGFMGHAMGFVWWVISVVGVVGHAEGVGLCRGVRGSCRGGSSVCVVVGHRFVPWGSWVMPWWILTMFFFYGCVLIFLA